MYPASFSYSAPTRLSDALALLAEHGDDAKLIAGGHSLLPLMKLRFAQPAHLVDLRRVEGLAGMISGPDGLRIGAMTTHAAVAGSATVRELVPMLSDAAGQIGDPQVRNRGTIGGSLAHADPAADLPAVILAADAQMTAVGPRGSRVIAADDFFVGLLASALAGDEVLTEIRIPAATGRTGSAYAKCPHPASRFALVGVAVLVQLGASRTVERARIGVTGMGTHAARVPDAEARLVGTSGTPADVQAAAALIGSSVDPSDDLQGDVTYKRNLARVYAERAISSALQRANS